MIEITNPAFNYDKYGHQYSGVRKTDPQIEALVHQALGDARTVLNVGAGSGSYEPEDRYVIAVEPSAVMRAQRPPHRVPAIQGSADALPFDDNAFDASMAMVTIHHWPDIAKGLQELRRVTRGQVVVLTFDPDALDSFWMSEYGPEVIAVEKARYPKVSTVTDALGGNCEVIPVPVTLHCLDGFQEAFYGRPEAFLQKEVRRSQSAWGFLDEQTEAAIVTRLTNALASGEWDQRYGHLRTQPEATYALRLIVGHR